jgi:hypothetical protein
MKNNKPINSFMLPLLILLLGVLGANYFSEAQTQRSSNTLLARLNSQSIEIEPSYEPLR